MSVPQKIQKKVQISEIFEENEKLSEEQEVSMRIDIENEEEE